MSVGEALTNFAGRSPEHRPALASNATVLAAALGAFAVGIVAGLLLIAPGVGPSVSWELKSLALAMIPLLILQNYFERLVLADYGFRAINLAWLLTPLLCITINAVLFLVGVLTVTSAFSAWVIGQLAALSLLFWYATQRLGGFGRPDALLGRRIVGFGIKAHGSRVMMWGNYRLDQWLVGALAGGKELGLYSVAVAWTEALFLLPQALTLALRPDLVRAERREAGRAAAAAFRVAAVASLPLVVITLVGAPFLCITLFGSEFAGSVPDLRMLSVGAFGVVALKILGGALIAQRKPLLETVAIGAAFALTILLDILLIPSFGGFGAAVASTVAYLAGGVAVAIIATRTLSFSMRALAPTWSDVGTARAATRTLVKRLTPWRSSLTRDPS